MTRRLAGVVVAALLRQRDDLTLDQLADEIGVLAGEVAQGGGPGAGADGPGRARRPDHDDVGATTTSSEPATTTSEATTTTTEPTTTTTDGTTTTPGD